MKKNVQGFPIFIFFFPVKKTRLTLVKFQVGFGTQILKDMHLGFCQLSEE